MGGRAQEEFEVEQRTLVEARHGDGVPIAQQTQAAPYVLGGEGVVEDPFNWEGHQPFGGEHLPLVGGQCVGPDHAQGNVAVGEQGADAVFGVFELPGHGSPVRGDQLGG